MTRGSRLGTTHSCWPCEDDHDRCGECDAPEMCGCSCHEDDE